jgi:hypothetical protein
MYLFHSYCRPETDPTAVPSSRQLHWNAPFHTRKNDHGRFMNIWARTGRHRAKSRHRYPPSYCQPNHLYNCAHLQNGMYLFHAYCHPWSDPTIVPRLRQLHWNVRFSYRNRDYDRFVNITSCTSHHRSK